MSSVRKITFLFLLFFSVVSSGQNRNMTSVNKKALKYYHMAEEAYRKGENVNALQFLDKALGKDASFVEAWLFKGDILADEGKDPEAIRALTRSVELDPDFFPPVWAMLGRLYYETGDYQKSVEAYQKFLESEKIPEKRKKTVEKLLKISQEAAALSKANKSIHVTALDSSINTFADEYVNFVDASNEMIIFTRKVKYFNEAVKRQIVKESFFRALLEDPEKQEPFETAWMKNRNVGSLSFSADGRYMYFAGCGWDNGLGSCDIYMSEKKNGKWSEPVNLGNRVNTSGWESQPFISVDGKRLYFAARRKGGKGGSDIWMSFKLKNGLWGPPVNLGDSINTSGNEMAPFLYADGSTLIFSSDGWPSLGGKDLFISRKNKAGGWSRAENIGAPANTKANEINFIYSLDGKTAWISSDRDGKNYDIFRLPVYKKIKPSLILFVDGKVVDAGNNQPLTAMVLLTDLKSGQQVDSLIVERSRDFLVVLSDPGKYAFNIFARGYLPYSETFVFGSASLDKWKFKKTFRLEKIRKGNSFVLRNIYFDVDKYDLKPESFPELDKLIRFLKQNKGLDLSIIGHTDNSGTPEHNLKLSKERAYSVYKYLVNNGVDAKRISYAGKGAKVPMYPNDSKEHKSLNRRVEFVVE